MDLKLRSYRSDCESNSLVDASITGFMCIAHSSYTYYTNIIACFLFNLETLWYVHTPTCPYTPPYTPTHPHIPLQPPYSPTHPHIPIHTPTYPYTPPHIPTCSHLPPHTPTYPYTPPHAPTYPHTPLHTPIQHVIKYSPTYL